MVSFYQAEKKSAAPKAIEVVCESLDIMGRGVCKKDGKIYFVEDLLPGERARIVPSVSNAIAGSIASKDKSSDAVVSKYLETVPTRRAQSCPLQDQCGGCPLEHIEPEVALQAKIEGVAKLLTKSVLQGTLEAKSTKASTAQGSSKLGRGSTIKQVLAQKQAQAKNKARQKELQELSAAAAAQMAQPSFIERSPETGYRRACRLAIRADHGKMHLGFRGAKTQALVPVTACEVLTERNNALLEPLKALVNSMAGRKEIGHVELLDSDGAVGVLLRMTKALSAGDSELLRTFGKKQQVVVSVLEPFKQLDDTEVVRERVIFDTAVPAAAAAATAVDDSDPESIESGLFVKAHDCKIYCSPSSFVQVNSAVNQSMIERVLSEVQPHAGQKVLDLFSGLGNFALPIAKAGSEVVGIDIVSDMVRRANANAALNGIAENQARFFVADLEEPFESQIWAKSKYDVVVLDPGRMGAKRAVGYLSKMLPPKIVMISCNPLAAARDCSQLLGAHYKIESWGAFDMFPRTSHIEIMVVFSYQK